MKKKILVALLCATAALAITACDKKEEKKVTYAKLTLGTYKGVSVQTSTNEITEEELQEYIDYICESKSYTESKKEGKVEENDSIKVDYVSTIDGKEYTGGTQTGAVIALTVTTDKDGKKTYTKYKVDGITEALIGKNVGDVVEVDSKYADDYSDKTLAGKAVHFKITIKSIEEKVVPKFDDAFAKKEFAYLGYETAADLKAYLKEDMRIAAVMEEVWADIVEAAKAESYDSVELDELTDSYAEYQEYMIYSYTGYSIDEYLAAVGQTKDEFRKEMEESAKAELKEKMVIEEIIKAEDLKITEEEYQAGLKEYAGNYGYDKVEEFSSAYSSYKREDFEFSMLYEKVQEIIVKNCKIVEDYETTTGATTAGSADKETEKATK